MEGEKRKPHRLVLHLSWSARSVDGAKVTRKLHAPFAINIKFMQTRCQEKAPTDQSSNQDQYGHKFCVSFNIS